MDNGDRLRHVGYGDSPRDDPKGITDDNPSGQIKDHKAFLSYADLLIHEESRPETWSATQRPSP